MTFETTPRLEFDFFQLKFPNSIFFASCGTHSNPCFLASNHGGVRISNSAFWGPSDQISLIAGSGTVGFSNCIFSAWNHDKNPLGYAIDISEGTGVLQLTSNEFQQRGLAVNIGVWAKGAALVGNSFVGSQNENIKNTGSNTQLSANLFT